MPPLPTPLPSLSTTSRWPTSSTARRELEERQATAKSAYRLVSDRPEAKYKCGTCQDTGWVNAPLPGGIQNQEHCPDCYERNEIERLQALCGLTDRERMVNLSDIKYTRADSDTARMVRAAADFIANPIGILTIVGTCGNAKTLTLQAIVNHFVRKQTLAIYTTFVDAVSYVREAFSDESAGTAQSRVARLQNVTVLALDELDKVKPTDWVREVETQLLDRRYRDGLAGKCGTVIALNGSLDDLPPHLSSRLRDGRNVVVTNNDTDLRPLMKV